MKQNGEPSVEEILASIKQVIARDTHIPGPSAPRRAEARAALEDDVLELGEIAQMAPADGDETPLLTENTRASMRDSLAALAAISGPGAAPQIVRSGETSLEGMVRDLLRPALAEWLDKNLPALVERLVAAEIARIVGKKG
jgi:cell pole-organizing protein PopZ